MEQDIYNRIGKLEDGITDVKVELAQTYKDLINHHKMDEVNSNTTKKNWQQLRRQPKTSMLGRVGLINGWEKSLPHKQ